MAKEKAETENIRMIAQNKKAFHDFEITERFEAGIVLLGTEVKSLREGRANLKDSYARVKKDEAVLYGLHISPYSHASHDNHEPERVRKLLLHRFEIKKLLVKTQERGFSIVPLKLYFKGSKVKIEVALARGKKEYDKRESIKRKEESREMDRLRKRDRLS